MTLRYSIPGDWTLYDRLAVVEELTLAKAAILALTQMRITEHLLRRR